MEEEIITKKNFEKYFESNNVINKIDYVFYVEMEKIRIAYEKIEIDKNFKIDKNIITLLSL